MQLCRIRVPFSVLVMLYKTCLFMFHILKVVSMLACLSVAFREVYSPKLMMRSRLEWDELLMLNFLEV